jgi:hypothetical protein
MAVGPSSIKTKMMTRYYKKPFARHLGMGLRGGQAFQLPHLMPWIN